MSRPTAHRYASTLVALDYLEQGPRRKYRLGMRASDPGRSALGSTALRNVPSSCLARLREQSGCTASLAMLDGADIVYVDRARSSVRGQSEVTARLGPGSRLPAARTAMGKALLAHASAEQQRKATDAAFKDSTPKKIALAHEELLEELDKILEQGFAIADQLQIEGQRCIAAPLRSRSGEVIAAVEIAVASDAFSRAQAIERFVPLVMDSAAEMSAHLGYAPPEAG